VQCNEENTANLVEVTVTISWQDKRNVAYSVPFTTLFPKASP
jgi:hypothetical protein